MEGDAGSDADYGYLASGVVVEVRVLFSLFPVGLSFFLF